MSNEIIISVACGAVFGTLAAAPLFVLLGRAEERPNMGHGFAALAIAFLLIVLVLFYVHFRWPDAFVPFGLAAALMLPVVATVAALRR